MLLNTSLEIYIHSSTNQQSPYKLKTGRIFYYSPATIYKYVLVEQSTVNCYSPQPARIFPLCISKSNLNEITRNNQQKN